MNKEPKYKSITIPMNLFKIIEDYRFNNRISSLTKAAEEILKEGIENKGLGLSLSVGQVQFENFLQKGLEDTEHETRVQK